MSLWSALPGDRLLADVSLWSADLANLAAEVRRIEAAGVDLFHLDVSDAHFVPGLLFFPDLVASLRPLTRVPFHVHLMVDDPLPLIDLFADAGADLITVHMGNGERVGPALRRVRERGLSAGLALALEEPPESVEPYLDELELLLLMGTALGVKGQELSPSACGRIRSVRQLLSARDGGSRVRIGADGGIRAHTVPQLRSAGADLIVPGSLVFGSDDVGATFSWLRSLPLGVP